MTKKIILSLLFLSCCLSPLFAQWTANYVEPDFDPKMPPSPTAAAMLRFTDMKVNMSTGTPNISIPICEITSGSLKLPVTLRYNGSAIKVDENANNVGLGWSLQAEGVISKTPLGKVDDGSWDATNWNGALNSLNMAECANLESLANNGIDGVPDLYSFNFNGYGGKFIKKGPNHEIIMIPQQDLKIDEDPLTANWTITTPDGSKYFFTEKETTSRKNSSSVNKTESWYLSKIQSANGTDEINLHYQPTVYDVDGDQNYSLQLWFPTGYLNNYGTNTFLSGGGPGILTQTAGIVAGWQLDYITFNNGKLEYDIAWNDREDHYIPPPPLPGQPQPSYQVPRINGVYIKDANNNLIKAFHFNYSYYNLTSGNFFQKRLKLVGVIENASLSAAVSPKNEYSFQYNSTPLPSRGSLAQDHWGYYNGANSNTTLIPSFTLMGNTYSGANREPNPAFAKAGILEKIVYPTGGWTEFVWESNTVAPSSPTYTCYTPVIKDVTINKPSDPNVDENSPSITIPTGGLFTNGIPGTLSISVTATSPNGLTDGDINQSGSAGSLRIDGNPTPVEGHAFMSLQDMNYVSNVTLQPGIEYFVNAHCNGLSTNTYQVHSILTVQWPATCPSSDRIVGGIRVNKIINHDPVTNTDKVTKYDYSNPNFSNFSSGSLFKTPTYWKDIFRYENYAMSGPVPMFPCDAMYFQGISLNSSGNYSIGAGNHIYYGVVKEINGSNGEGGYSENYFTDFNYYPASGEMDLANYNKGILLKRKDYDNNNTLVHETLYSYTSNPNTNSLAVGNTAQLLGKHPCHDNINTVAFLYPIHFSQNTYYFPSEWFYQDQETDIAYYSGSSLTSWRKFYYDNTTHKSVTKIVSNNSDGTEIETLLKYPLDYSISGLIGQPAADAIYQMRLKHIDNTPVEVIKQKHTLSPSSYQVVGGHLSEFKVINTDWVVPDKSFSLKLSSPVTGYSLSDVANSVFTKDSHYQMDVQAVLYDERENVLEVNNNNEVSCFIYGYNKEYPIAKVLNAQQSEISYSGFEDDNMGNWNYNQANVIATSFLTGSKAYNLTNGAISNNNGPTGNGPTDFVISMWVKNGSGTVNVSLNNAALVPVPGNAVIGNSSSSTVQWTYYEFRFPYPIYNINGVPLSISGTATIDELRAYPADAEMETYTYAPLKGMTSKCDVSNFITFYDYDALGRLKLIRDQNGKIVKKIEYATQQPE